MAADNDIMKLRLTNKNYNRIGLLRRRLIKLKWWQFKARRLLLKDHCRHV